MSRIYALTVGLLLCCCYTQTVGQTRPSGFMPGSSPAVPNLALDMCQRQAVPKDLNISRSGKHAEPVYKWCSVYEDVLPCLGRTLPTANSASDWYLKLIYNQTTAVRMSRSLCARFPYVANLTCVENDMSSVGKCMQWTTKSAIDHFYGQFQPRQPLTEQKKKLAAIYACIISVATAGCFHKELKSCSEPKRKLMYDFYIMMSGKCRDIAGMPETTSPPPDITKGTSTLKTQTLETVPENQLESKSSQGPGQPNTATGNVNTNTGKPGQGTPKPSTEPKQPSSGKRNTIRGSSNSRNNLSGANNASSLTVNLIRLLIFILPALVLSRL